MSNPNNIIVGGVNSTGTTTGNTSITNFVMVPFALGEVVQHKTTGLWGNVSTIDNSNGFITVNGVYEHYSNWFSLNQANQQVHQQMTWSSNHVDLNSLGPLFDPMKAFLNGIGAEFPPFLLGKCDSCKEDSKEILMKYSPFKITRQICKDCVVRKVDSIFGVAGIDPKVEKVLYGK